VARRSRRAYPRRCPEPAAGPASGWRSTGVTATAAGRRAAARRHGEPRVTQLIWLRRDLRVSDNTALGAAMAAGPTIALFLLTPGQWHRHDDAPCKVDFWLRNLAELATELR